MEWFSPVDLLEFLPVLCIPCERNCRMWKLRLECHIISKSNVESSGWERPKKKWKLSVNKLETGRRKASGTWSCWLRAGGATRTPEGRRGAREKRPWAAGSWRKLWSSPRFSPSLVPSWWAEGQQPFRELVKKSVTCESTRIF